MGTLAELWDATAPTQPNVKNSSNQIAPNVQSKRDQYALTQIQQELGAAQSRLASATDPQQKMMHQADIAALQREIAFKSKTTPAVQTQAAPSQAAPTAPAANSTNFADLWDATSTAPTAAPTQTSTAGAGRGSYEGYSPTEEAAGKTKQNVSNVRQIFGNVLKKGFEARAQVPAFAAAVADIPFSLPQFVTGTVAYPAARVLGGTPEESKKFAESVSAPLGYLKPGQLTGVEETAKYMQSLPAQTMQFISENIDKGVNWVAEKTGLNPNDVQAAVNVGMLAGPKVVPKVAKTMTEAAKQTKVGQQLTEAAKEMELVRPNQAPQGGMVSAGAAAVPDATTIKQALSVATPELQQALKDIPTEKVNLPTLQRHIEADSLPMPVRLTEGQATGDVVKLSNEQNRRGKDPMLAQRFNEQNGQLVDNLGLIREKAAPDVYGSKTIENSQGIIDAYKDLDKNLNTGINADYQALRDAAGGQFPVDAPQLLKNVETKLKKELLSNEAPAGQFSELKKLAENNSMTFEDYLSLRRNLGDIARTSQDGSVRKAAGYMIEELEKLPLQKEAAALKPLADKARASAKARFQMLEKDPAMKAAVDDSVPADKFIDKFVVNGVNKNINTMVDNLGKDSPAHQHMAAGTINWLTDKAGIVDGNGNFSQAGYNKALKKLEDVKNINAIFNQESASQLKTLGNVARYTQAQPRGAFVNNSNTLVGAMAEKAASLAKGGVEKGLNYAVPGVQLGTSLMETRARRAAAAETQKALELGAGTKQTGKNKIQDLGK